MIRELGLRQRVYPGWVAKGKMKADAAEREIATMNDVRATLRTMDALTQERDTLRALWVEWLDGMYDGQDLLRRVRIAVHGPLSRDQQAEAAETALRG